MSLRAAFVLAALAASAVGFLLLEPAPPPPPPRPVVAGRADGEPAPPVHDDSGFITAYEMVDSNISALSLEETRIAFTDLGARARKKLERELAAASSPDERAKALARIARVHLYDGEFGPAEERLAEARRVADGIPERHRAQIVFLQGIAALRRGEIENCVRNHCSSSCIAPLDAAAVHRKPDGARKALGFFTEYLRTYPKSVVARWLVNVCHMTLGEWPRKVPKELLYTPTSFSSKVQMKPFVEVGARVGVDRLDPSGGAIMDDFDGDGLLDVVESSWLPTLPMSFWRNKGDGTFEDRTKQVGMDRHLGGFYICQTDYNNDGRLDVFVSRTGLSMKPMRNSLLRQEPDGTYTDVSKESRLAWLAVQSLSASWADYDNDGWLDLFVCVEGHNRSRLYRNRGDGSFEELALKAGVDNTGFSCKGAAWGDIDGDRYPDLYLANHNSPARLYRNNRDGTFTDVSEKAGISPPYFGFSCWFFDYDNDGRPDIFAAAFNARIGEVIQGMVGEPHRLDTMRLYRNVDGKRFEDVSKAAGLEVAPVVMGSNFVDIDNDGYLDMYLGTGSPPYSFLVPNRMFKNMGGKRFEDVTAAARTGHLQKGHSVACGDWDRDGDVDIFEQMGGIGTGDGSRNVLYNNPGHGNHWLTVKLTGVKTNRAAIGARIKVTLGAPENRDVYRTVCSGSSFGANALQQTIGLGKATRAGVEVFWPTSDTKQVFENVAADQSIAVKEFEKTFTPLAWTRVPFEP
jgi:hypothetical protein